MRSDSFRQVRPEAELWVAGPTKRPFGDEPGVRFVGWIAKDTPEGAATFDRLMRKALRCSGARTKRAVVEEGLRLLVQTKGQSSVRRLRDGGVLREQTRWMQRRRWSESQRNAPRKDDERQGASAHGSIGPQIDAQAPDRSPGGTIRAIATN